MGWRPQRLIVKDRADGTVALGPRGDPAAEINLHVQSVRSVSEAQACLQLGLSRAPTGVWPLESWSQHACVCVDLHIYSAVGSSRVVYISMPHQLTAPALAHTGADALQARHLFCSLVSGMVRAVPLATLPQQPPHPLTRWLHDVLATSATVGVVAPWTGLVLDATIDVWAPLWTAWCARLGNQWSLMESVVAAAPENMSAASSVSAEGAAAAAAADDHPATLATILEDEPAAAEESASAMMDASQHVVTDLASPEAPAVTAASLVPVATFVSVGSTLTTLQTALDRLTQKHAQLLRVHQKLGNNPC